MADEKNAARARKVYRDLCAALDRRKWHYKTDESKLVVAFGVNGEDIPMDFIIVVDEKRQLIRCSSPLPFKFSENKRMEGAIVTCIASNGLADGSFDYDLATGQIAFRLTATFRDSDIGDSLFQYLIECACAVVDCYNDRFLDVNNGKMSLDQFIQAEG